MDIKFSHNINYLYTQNSIINFAYEQIESEKQYALII